MTSLDTEPHQGESFRWRVRLSDKAPHKRWVVGLCAIAAGLLGYGFGGPLMGLAGFAIILGSTVEFWLGSRYSIDEKGVSAKTGLSVSSMEWGEVRRLTWGNDGVRLSPLANAGT